MKTACSGKKLTVDEIKNIKLLLANGFDISEICQKTKRSYTSVLKIRDGFYDFCLDTQEAKEDKVPTVITASNVDIDTVQAILSLEDEVVSTLMSISKKSTEKTNEISAALLEIARAIDRNTEAQMQANKGLEEQPKQAADTTSKATEAQFLKWDEVVRRAAAISDKTTEKVMKRTTATMKGSSIYVQCDDTDRKYFLTHGTALETLRKQASLVCGYSVKIGLA